MTLCLDPSVQAAERHPTDLKTGSDEGPPKAPPKAEGIWNSMDCGLAWGLKVTALEEKRMRLVTMVMSRVKQPLLQQRVRRGLQKHRGTRRESK